MQVTCPRCRALADRTYERPLLRRTKCSCCGYDLEEVNIKEGAKLAEIVEKELERKVEEEVQRDMEAFREALRLSDEKWLEDHAGVCTPMWCGPVPKDKIPPEGYWRVPATLREWLQILGVKDIDAAEEKVKKAGPFNQRMEIAWHLWRKGEI